MNKNSGHDIKKLKAGYFTCLFLLFTPSPRVALPQQWSFDSTSGMAYELALNLQIEEALKMIPEPKTVQDYYVVTFAEALELMITEDMEKFSEYEEHFQSLLDKKIKSSDRDYQFLRAEAHLQWAFVYLKFGKELDAASHLRQAYQIASDCRRKSGDFLAIQKTYGLLQIIVGSVPEKYNWVLSLLGMEGSIPDGLANLENVRHSDSPVAFEAELLSCLVQGFVFQKPGEGLASVKKILEHKTDNRLTLYVAATLALKNAKSEEALSLLDTLTRSNTGTPVHYADYLRGEVYLHKGDYLNAISSYRWFINHYKGQNYLKDAHYKIGLCYWLNGNTNDALLHFRDAKIIGKESSEADRSAANSLMQKELPNVYLSKVRYATDGGYYAEARQILGTITDRHLPGKRDKVEYYYRKGRLEHNSGNIEAAKLFYRQTIDMVDNENWYFAPNACLQLGYILVAERNPAEAKKFFQRALGYKRHEYKNSIDAKAKSALSAMR